METASIRAFNWVSCIKRPTILFQTVAALYILSCQYRGHSACTSFLIIYWIAANDDRAREFIIKLSSTIWMVRVRISIKIVDIHFISRWIVKKCNFTTWCECVATISTWAMIHGRSSRTRTMKWNDNTICLYYITHSVKHPFPMVS